MASEPAGILVSCGTRPARHSALQLPGGKALTAAQMLNARSAQVRTGQSFRPRPVETRLMALDARAAAAQVIGDVLRAVTEPGPTCPKLAQVSDRDRALLQQLCYGTLRHSTRLQAFLDQLLDKPLRDKDSDAYRAADSAGCTNWTKRASLTMRRLPKQSEPPAH